MEAALGTLDASLFVRIQITRRRRPRRPLAPPRAEAAGAAVAPRSRPEVLAELDALLSASPAPEAEARAAAAAAAARAAGALRCFGAARGVPKRQYSLAELRLNKIEPGQLLSPEDSTLNRTRTLLQAALGAGLAAAAAGGAPFGDVAGLLLVLGLAAGVDTVGFGGGLEGVVLDSAARAAGPITQYARRVAVHEAGHFLVAYLLGLLPTGYELSAADALRARGLRGLGQQAGTRFCDGAFQAEVASGRLSAPSLDVYCCVALAGVCTEAERYGRAEGGLADVRQLDALLQALKFSQAKSNDQVRFAVLNTVTLLRRHARALDALADAMEAGASVGGCIGVLEAALEGCEEI